MRRGAEEGKLVKNPENITAVMLWRLLPHGIYAIPQKYFTKFK